MPEDFNREPGTKPLIEIPQEFYDKVNREKEEREALAKKELELKEQSKKEVAKSSQLLSFVIVNIVFILGILILTITKNNYILIGLPVYIVLFSIINAKKSSDYPVSVLLGGIFSGIVSFGISFLKEDTIDIWTYYTIASVVVGILGYIISGFFTWLINNYKNIKALQTLFVIGFIALLGFGPYYLFTKYPEFVGKYVFMKSNTIVATSEKEYILKTLKNRYGEEFICDEDLPNTGEYNTDVSLQGWIVGRVTNPSTLRGCLSKSGNYAAVTSVTYEKSDNEYIVIDDYINSKYLESARNDIGEKVKSLSSASKVNVYFYHEDACKFVGDCIDYYYSGSDKEFFDSSYNISSNLNLKKYLNQNSIDFINDYKFNIIIYVVGTYSTTSSGMFEGIVNNILNTLNSMGYKNTLGYVIEFQDSLRFQEKVYRVSGKTNDSLSFKDPVVE